MTSGPRDFAAELGALDDDALAALFAARRVSSTVPWRDFFDAAEFLVDDVSLSRALESLTSDDLTALAHAAENGAPIAAPHDVPARALGLAHATGVPLPEVGRLLAARALEPTHPGSLAAPASASAENAAAERAFTSAAALGDILIHALHAPLVRIGSGSLGAAERRRIAEDLPHPEDLDALVALAEQAGLLAVEGRLFLPTSAAEDWLRQTTTRRWSIVARSWSTGLPRGLRHPEGWSHPAEWAVAYPADASWPEQAGALRRQALAWGLITPDDAVPTWTSALLSAPEIAERDLAALLPHEVDRIYLQNDLTAISPGPLASGLDVRLRRLARRESHAQASTYRFTADTIAGALTEGETAESMIAFLTDLSLSGVPQPLEYLVRTTADSHGLIRVGLDPEAEGSPRTRVWSPEPQMLETVAVDQSLRALGLVRTPDGAALTTRAPRESVLWALVDARYPAVAVDAAGEIQPLTRHRLATEPAALAPDPSAYADVIQRLRGADAGDADLAWMERELVSAVRARGVVEVTVALPGGEARTFVLEASGLGGGRLRGKERGTDVERTLPVSSITAIRRL